MHAPNRLDAVTVMINDLTAIRTDWMPFAGTDVSNFGTGGIPSSMRVLTQEYVVQMSRN